MQVDVAVGGGAVQQQAVAAALAQAVADGRMVEGQVHGVARLGVGVLEVQLRAGRQAGAGAAQGDPRGVSWRSGSQGFSALASGRCLSFIGISSGQLRQGLAERRR